ncbi:MAG: uracil phosphoribosyltransferase [Planctomycetota bacterium]|jgi:uracil phosphoribosyltransferase|nr:uracil phosphoribosyltransferase [Planctomycetota bacterium]MDP6520524.1 uracil phosphoribosyltransferase [Planctomycetota bacterium]MDP6838881.1 uracil phosphoribosyltransferase [Planctomycetota bacterium]
MNENSTEEYTKTIPMPDPTTNQGSRTAGWERAHLYGSRVHILNNLFLLTALARLGSDEVGHPEMVNTLRTTYISLCIAACGQEFPEQGAEIETRMSAVHPRAGVYRGPAITPETRVVVADIIRAGIIPSQTCFELLNTVLPTENIRLDHLTMARVTDEQGRVTGVDLSGSKIGGTVEGAILILPDPMGATGATTVRAVRHYREHHGEPALIIAMPMISTPEYMRAVLDNCANTVIYTARLDRGLSPPEVLTTVPGTLWDRERGLDDSSYIVPGAGGMGEVLNNSWC